MESVCALAACLLSLALSFYVGHAVASGGMAASVISAAIGLGFAVLYFVLAVAVGVSVPGILEPATLGVHFVALLALLPVVSAYAGLKAYRRLERLERGFA